MPHCLSAKSSPIPEGSCRRGRPVPWTLIARNLLQRSPILDRRKTGSTGGLLMMMQFKKCSFGKKKIKLCEHEHKQQRKTSRKSRFGPAAPNMSRLWPGCTKSPKTLIRKLWQQSTPYWSKTAKLLSLAWALAIRMLTNGEAVAVQPRVRPTGWPESWLARNTRRRSIAAQI